MSELLQRPTVLVLNRHWQAIAVKTPAEAFCMMANGAASALNMADGAFVPTTWAAWLALPVTDGDAAAKTARGPVRIPTVLVLARFDKVPRRRPRLGLRGLWERDGGRCQYTGRKLAHGEGNIDHVMPLARGGDTSWENCVLSHKTVNNRKGCRTPAEAGLRLLRAPAAPRELPVTYLIRNHLGIEDWEPFLPKR
jgi:5-methylcytosine-specific restriction endonuclease McrA